MKLATTFKISLYLLTALSGGILGIAEEGWIPFCSLPAALIGFLWSEMNSTGEPRGMNDRVASVCGFAALLAATNEFFDENLEGRLLSGTHLVVYLTWIVLLQRKTDRRYWLLMALGVLQIAVASILTSGRATPWFGVSALVYVCAAVWTLSVFSLKRSEAQFALPAEGGSEGKASPSHHSVAIGSVQIEDGVTWISTAFVVGVVITNAAGLVVSVLFFLLIPRVWMPTAGAIIDDEPSGSGRRTVMATQVRLGHMGSILERLDPVLQLRVHTTGRSIISAQEYAERIGLAEPLFRGAVLSDYEAPVWKADAESIQRPQRLIPIANKKMVRQEIRMEDVGTDTMLFLGSPLGLLDAEDQARGNYQWVTNLVHRIVDPKKPGPVRYSVFSELPAEPQPHNAVVVNEFVRAQYVKRGYLDRLKYVPPGLGRLAQLARQVVADERQRRGTDLNELQVAQAIESFLRDSGEYTYTLVGSVRDPTIDPLEDFLFNRKEGHCEYFASALVLMLRAVDIPARLINGYKGGNYNEDTKTLYVQQRHAHAWCEAWIDDRSWVTFDATPTDERAASVESISANQTFWADWKSKLTTLWSDNVVNISYDRQDEAIYSPLRELIANQVALLKELWESPRASLIAFLQLLISPRRWFSPRGAGALFLVIATSWLACRLVRRVCRKWHVWDEPQNGWSVQRRVEFYERFTRLMQSLDLQRAESQTQQEFARQAALALQPRLQSVGMTSGPAEISDLFYKVRFGDVTLAENDCRRVEELLVGMERILRPPQPTPRSS